MSNQLLAKSYVAEAAVGAFLIAKPGAAAGSFTLATAVGDKLFGVTTDIPSAIGERGDVIHAGGAYVTLGGTGAVGDLCTSDASGRAVVAAPAAGVNNNTIVQLLEAGVVGDVVRCLVIPGRVQG